MDGFWGNIFKVRKKDEEGTIGILKKIPIYESLTRKELTAVDRILHRREYKPNEVIFYQGDSGIGMYIIESGSVSIVFETTRQVLTELHDGEFFGEMALLNEAPRSATASAKTHCKILFFSQTDLFDLLERDSGLGMKIVLQLARIIGERLKMANDQVQALHKELHDLKARRGDI